MGRYLPVDEIAPVEKVDFATIRQMLSNLLNVLRLISKTLQYAFDGYKMFQNSPDVGQKVR